MPAVGIGIQQRCSWPGKWIDLLLLLLLLNPPCPGAMADLFEVGAAGDDDMDGGGVGVRYPFSRVLHARERLWTTRCQRRQCIVPVSIGLTILETPKKVSSCRKRW